MKIEVYCPIDDIRTECELVEFYKNKHLVICLNTNKVTFNYVAGIYIGDFNHKEYVVKANSVPED